LTPENLGIGGAMNPVFFGATLAIVLVDAFLTVGFFYVVFFATIFLMALIFEALLSLTYLIVLLFGISMIFI
jgi:hypothetical protein